MDCKIANIKQGDVFFVADGLVSRQPERKNKKRYLNLFERNPTLFRSWYSKLGVCVCISCKVRGPRRVDLQILTPTGDVVFLLRKDPTDIVDLLSDAKP